MADAAPLRVFLGLIVVIAAILLCGWFARRSGLAGRAQGGAMRIVDSLNIGPRQRIVLLEVEDTWVLVGVTAGQMNVLHTLPAGEIAASQRSGALAASLTASLTTSFATSLAAIGRKPGRPQPDNAPLDGGDTGQSGQREDTSFANKLGQALRRG